MIKISKTDTNISLKLGDFIKKYSVKNQNYTGKQLYEAYIDDNSRKKQLQKILFDEQSGLCCYCMSRISIEDMTIEHFKPKDKYKQLALKYHNLLASCRTAGQCDNSKGNKELRELYNPADKQKNIEDLITYKLNGEIKPNEAFLERNNYSENRRTDLMININIILNLNNDNLIKNRKNVLNTISTCINKKKKAPKNLGNPTLPYYGYIKFAIEKLQQN
ncbi:MAG: TIGR02646 family protein [Bacteroidales bacterium]|nr:TIGR02646 family protein [Bacteroidales bacterium]